MSGVTLAVFSGAMLTACGSSQIDDTGASQTAQATEDDSTSMSSSSGASATNASDSTGGPLETSTGPGQSDASDSGSSGGRTEPSAVIFVNFDGADLANGPDDAPSNTTQIPAMATTLAPFGQGPKRDEMFALIVEHWAPFNVDVTDERPSSGDYLMAVVTPTNPVGAAFIGVAPPDCDNTVANNIVFAFDSERSLYGAGPIANIVSHNLGRVMGLRQVDDMGDLMHFVAQLVPPPAMFTDTCANVDLEGDCGAPLRAAMAGCRLNTQSSRTYLLEELGAR